MHVWIVQNYRNLVQGSSENSTEHGEAENKTNIPEHIYHDERHRTTTQDGPASSQNGIAMHFCVVRRRTTIAYMTEL